MEVFPEGSASYMNSSERDATYEEILHFVHGFGIQLALPGMQMAIESAMDAAIENDYYNPLFDLPEEDYDEEYLAMGWNAILVSGLTIPAAMGTVVTMSMHSLRGKKWPKEIRLFLR